MFRDRFDATTLSAWVEDAGAAGPIVFIAVYVAATKPEGAWTVDDWRAIAHDLDRMRRDALEGWGKSVAELESQASLIRQQADTIKQQDAILELLGRSMELLKPAPATPTRGRGRP